MSPVKVKQVLISIKALELINNHDRDADTNDFDKNLMCSFYLPNS